MFYFYSKLSNKLNTFPTFFSLVSYDIFLYNTIQHIFSTQKMSNCSTGTKKRSITFFNYKYKTFPYYLLLLELWYINKTKFQKQEKRRKEREWNPPKEKGKEGGGARKVKATLMYTTLCSDLPNCSCSSSFLYIMYFY